MTAARRFGSRIQAVIQRRAPHGQPPLRISKQRVYILPSATGALFGVLLIAMLTGATNYGKNLAFALTFWLAAVALVSIHRAHRNLVGLEIAAVTAEPVFAGETASFAIRLASQARLPRRGLGVYAAHTTPKATFSVGPGAPAVARVEARTLTRGRLSCPRLTFASCYPMGLFRCWSHVVPVAQVLVYPVPIDHRAAALLAPAAGSQRPHRQKTGERRFAGHRRFQAGDPQRQIDWKASARANQLLVTEHEAAQTAIHWFDHAGLDDLAPEARLSQLAFWVLEADREDRAYGLRLPGHSLGPARGPAHRRACLEALALF